MPKFAVAPATVSVPKSVKPLKPDRLEPALSVRVLAVPDEPSERVPLPESVPLRVINPPVAVVGLLPKGKLQSLLIVRVPLEWLIVTALKLTLLQARVALPVLAMLTVPLLCVNVPPVMVMVLLRLMVPEGAVKVPEAKVKVPLTVMGL